MKIKQKTIWKVKSYEKIKKDEWLGYLLENHPNQISDWVDENIKNQEDMKKLIKKLLYAIRYLLKHQCEIPDIADQHRR